MGRRRDFTGEVVVITGGASGIGLALGRVFSEAGARVALLDLDGEGATARARELERSGAREALGLACDVTDAEASRSAIEAVIERFGGVDVLINNAGITLREAFASTSVEALRRVMEVNFFGAVHCSKPALESLIERQGMLIVTSSIAGLVPVLGRAGYCASKFALQGLFGTIRAELRDRGVTVLVVCPSFVKTDLQTRALGGDGEVTAHPQSTTGRVETPERVAAAIFKAATRGREQLVLSPIGRLSQWLNFLAPPLYERLMRRSMKAELER